jgi:TRAP transporter TAXI family solute receptor
MITNRKAMCRCTIRFFRRTLIILLFLIVGFFPYDLFAFDILLGTGETGTFSHFTGRTICRIANKQIEELNCKTVPGPNEVHNLTNLQGGSLDIGLVDSRMLYDAIHKKGQFEFLDIRYDNLRTLVPFYNVPITLVVRRDAGIASLDALKEKRINAGAPGSHQHLAVDTIMKAKNWSKKDFRLVDELPASQSQDTMAFCHGSIQAMVHIGVHPDPSLLQLVKLCKAGLLNMDDADIGRLINDHPAFFKVGTPANTYPSQSNEIVTFGTRAILVGTEDLDQETAYNILKAIYDDQEKLTRAHPALYAFTTIDVRKIDVGIPLHPGAAQFLSEHGM